MGPDFIAEPNSESGDPAFAKLIRRRFEYNQVYRYSRGVKPRQHHALIEHIHALYYPDPEHRLAS